MLKKIKKISKKYLSLFLIGAGLTLVLTWPIYAQIVGVNQGFITIDFRFIPLCAPLPAEARTVPCQAGYIGRITQARTSSCPGPIWSNWSTTSDTCTPPPPPKVNLTMKNETTGDQVSNGGFPLAARQTHRLTLSWNVSNAESCTASANPLYKSVWTDNKVDPAVNPTGSVTITNTEVKGTYVFGLTCRNAIGDQVPSTIQVNITQLQKPYIQTTGGDVHTNESINISQ